MASTDFVKSLYTGLLGRASTDAETNFWASRIDLSVETPNQVALDILNSAEGLKAQTVARYYQAAFNRIPDAAGLNVQLGAVAGATPAATLSQLADGFVASTEFQTKYAGLSATDFVTKLYANILSRPADPAGLAVQVNFYNSLIAGGKTVAQAQSQLLQNFANSAEFTGGPLNASKTILLYNAIEARMPTTAEVQSAVGITSDVLVSALNDGIQGNGAGAGSLTRFTGLFSAATAGSVVQGTDGNDLISATNTSLVAGTIIDGKGGIDRLQVTVGGAVTAGAVVQNVEQVYVTATADTTADVSTYTGVQEVWANNSVGKSLGLTVADKVLAGITGAGTKVDVASAATSTSQAITLSNANITGNVTAAGAALTTVNVNLAGAGNTVGGNLDLASATATAKTINVSALADGTVTGNLVTAAGTTLNVSGTNAFTVGGTSAAVTTLNVTGGSATLTGASGVTTVTTSGSGSATVTAAAGVTSATAKDSSSISLGAVLAAGAVVDGSATSGTITVIAAADSKITGGSGNDKVTLSVDPTTATIVGGAGTDTLVVANNKTYEVAGSTGAEKNVSGFEVLDVQNTNGTYDFNATGVAGKAGFTTAIADAATVTFNTGATGGPALQLTGANTAFNLNVTGATGAGQNDSFALTHTGKVALNTVVTAPGIENFTVAAAAGADTKIKFVDAALTNLTVTGGTAAKTTLTLDVNSSTTANLKVDVSGYAGTTSVDASTYTSTTGATLISGTGATTLKGSTNNDVINASASTKGATLTGGGGADTIIGGSGSDIIKVTGSDTVAKVGSTVTGGAGKDTFDFSGAAVSSLDSIQTITDFSLTDDVVKLTNTSFKALDAATTDAVSKAATLTAALGVVEAFINSASKVTAFTYAGTTYLVDTGATTAATDDIVVKLSGTFDVTKIGSTSFV